MNAYAEGLICNRSEEFLFLIPIDALEFCLQFALMLNNVIHLIIT